VNILLLSDSKFLLNDAAEQLEIIQKFYDDSIHHKEISPVLRLKIKHFLEDIKSSLDYTAYTIFTIYSIEHIKMKLEDHQRQVCFPVKHTDKKFDDFIKNVFPELNNKNPEIVDFFKSVQPCYGETVWYNDLNELVNKNKHRYLTPQYKKEVTQINYMKDVLGNTYNDVTIESNSGTLIAYGDSMVDVTGKKTNPFIEEIDASVWVDFVFKDLNKSVMPTLFSIYDGSNKIINDIERVI
jgi:hypothetical protein